MEYQNYTHIKNIAKEFINNTFGNEIPENYCFITCFPLSILLDLQKIEHTLSAGFYIKTDGIVPHFWITLDDQKTIIDPTIRQFDHNQDSVYLGKLCENSITLKYNQTGTGENINIWFDETYENWKKPLLQLYSPEMKLCHKNRMIMNIKTSAILYKYFYHNNKWINEFMMTEKCKMYYYLIFNFILSNIKNNTTFFELIATENYIDIKRIVDAAYIYNKYEYKNID